jgi:ribonuclease Z
MLPSPTEPLYLITHRAVLLYVYEYSDLEDLGINGDLKCGVVPVLSESLHWKRTGIWQTDPENSVPIETLPCLNIEG